MTHPVEHDTISAVVAELRSTDDPIEQMFRVIDVSREHDLLISRKWVQAWAEQWQTERAELRAKLAACEGDEK